MYDTIVNFCTFSERNLYCLGLLLKLLRIALEFRPRNLKIRK